MSSTRRRRCCPAGSREAQRTPHGSTARAHRWPLPVGEGQSALAGSPDRHQAVEASMASSTAWVPAGPSSRTQSSRSPGRRRDPPSDGSGSPNDGTGLTNPISADPCCCRHRLCEACVSSRAPPANHGKQRSTAVQKRKAVTWASSLVTACQVGRPRQDSNLRTRLRRPMLYPLSYEGREGQGSALAPGGRTSARASRPTTGTDLRPWRMRRGSSTPCARAGTSS